MPSRQSIEQSNKQIVYMPVFANKMIGTKIMSIFPENRMYNMPTLSGVMLLNDYITGVPIAIMDGQAVTAWRTGAVGGVAIKYLSKKECHSVGIVGAGVEGFYQAVYACATREIHTIYIFNHHNKDLTEYSKCLKKTIGNDNLNIIQCKDVKELVVNSDIICTATPSETPVLPNDKELLRGKCIIAVGSYKPNMREIPDAIFDLVENVYIELPYACEESGDLSQPIAEGRLKTTRIKLFHEYLTCTNKKIKDGETTYFKSVGMALFDLCIAQKLYELATLSNV